LIAASGTLKKQRLSHCSVGNAPRSWKKRSSTASTSCGEGIGCGAAALMQWFLQRNGAKEAGDALR
jgi:hypothetical protein